jgi:hypothetical protein
MAILAYSNLAGAALLRRQRELPTGFCRINVLQPSAV